MGEFFSPTGRLGRSDYVAVYIGMIVLGIFARPFSSEVSLIVSSIASALVKVPILLAQIKRLHDRDKSGAWILLNAIPALGQLYLFVELCFLKGTSGANRFGPAPGEAYAPLSDAAEVFDEPSDIQRVQTHPGKLWLLALCALLLWIAGTTVGPYAAEFWLGDQFLT